MGAALLCQCLKVRVRILSWLGCMVEGQGSRVKGQGFGVYGSGICDRDLKS